jgi:glutathione S-transferase
MADLTFYTNPQSRGQIIRWMLEEVGEPYETVILDYATTLKGEEYLAINPMGKIPAIRHKGKVVTEVAAICAYLADAFPSAGLSPPTNDRADYYRFLFFASGPIEQAFSNRAAGFEPTPERQRMFGYGNFDLAIGTMEKLLTGRTYICGDQFTAADLYVASQLGFMMMFDMLEARSVFSDYVARCTDREAYRRAKQIDTEAGEQLKAQAAQ